MEQNQHRLRGKPDTNTVFSPLPRDCQRPESTDPDWQRALPAEWRMAAVMPRRFATYHDDDMPATRSLGYDEAGTPCYCRQTFLLGALRLDDDEFYETFDYGEEVHAWRLQDSRWLIWRRVHRDGDCRHNRGVYSFAECMPR